MGTYKTNSSEMYDKPLKKLGITITKLSSERQMKLSQLIIKLINNTYNEGDKAIFNLIQDSLVKNGAEAIILACTDLHLLMDKSPKIRTIDTMEVLAQRLASLVQEE